MAVRGIGVLLLQLVFVTAWARTGVELAGRIANENGAPIPGARLLVREPGKTESLAVAYTSPEGEFSLRIPTAGEYRIDVQSRGHFPLLDQALALAPGRTEADFTLTRSREVLESVEVVATSPPINMETAQSADTVTGTELLNIPYTRSNNLKNALRVMPGVLPDGRGNLHINGGKEEQTLYTLNGFNVSDPLTGRFDTRLSVESVQTVDISSGLASAEHGKSSAGVLAVNTKTGDDKLRYSATNFFPGVEFRKGLYIGNWSPRGNISGPIKKGRAWFANSFDAVYLKTIVDELPKGEDRTNSWLIGNHFNTQVNLTPSNILYAGFLLNIYTAPRYGLGVLDPRETTVDRRSRQWFFHVKDQMYLPNRVLVEVGYAANRTFGREIPQGQDLYQLTPEGRRGNYFLDATRTSSRDQALVNAFLPEFQLLGEHRIKAGLDLNRLSYWQEARRTGFESYSADFIRTRSTVFRGSGRAELVNYETSLYLLDSWKPHPRLLVELGLRGDWDQILHYWNASPRLGAAWQPPGLDRTKISGGFGLMYDATNLRVFTRPLDQYALTTYYDEHGQAERGPALTAFTIQNPRPARPRYRNWTAGIEQEFGAGIQGRLEYLRRSGRYGFTYANVIDAPGKLALPFQRRFEADEYDAVYRLTNGRGDSYAHFRVTVRQAIQRKYEWLLSYTRSSARSNAVVDADIDEPVIVYDNAGPMPWDAPNRFVSWGYLPTFWKSWAFAYLAEYRSGFPYSIVNEFGRVEGQVNSLRFPSYFQLNLHLERRFSLKNHLWAFRAGCNNATNRSNPTVVNNHVGSANFLQFYGGSDRSFNFRLRWLGRTGK